MDSPPIHPCRLVEFHCERTAGVGVAATTLSSWSGNGWTLWFFIGPKILWLWFFIGPKIFYGHNNYNDSGMLCPLDHKALHIHHVAFSDRSNIYGDYYHNQCVVPELLLYDDMALRWMIAKNAKGQSNNENNYNNNVALVMDYGNSWDLMLKCRIVMHHEKKLSLTSQKHFEVTQSRDFFLDFCLV